jgi:hypothetical protein
MGMSIHLVQSHAAAQLSHVRGTSRTTNAVNHVFRGATWGACLVMLYQPLSQPLDCTSYYYKTSQEDDIVTTHLDL